MLQNYRFSGTFKTVTLTNNVNKQYHTTIYTYLYNIIYYIQQHKQLYNLTNKQCKQYYLSTYYKQLIHKLSTW